MEKPTAVLLGQYLAAINILTAQEEDLHVRMLTGAARAGHRSVVFKLHPTAPAGYAAALSKAAADAGVRLTVLDAPLLAEALYHHCAPELVVGCFSTAMVTASAYYDVPVARVGTALVTERLKPYPEQQPGAAHRRRPPGAGPGARRDPGAGRGGPRVAGAAGAERSASACSPRPTPGCASRRRPGCGPTWRPFPAITSPSCG